MTYGCNVAGDEIHVEDADATERSSQARTWRQVAMVWVGCFVVIFPIGIWKAEVITGTWFGGVILSTAGTALWALAFTVLVLVNARR